jgi:nitrate/nitrite transport system substrate-binding protein
MSLQNPLNANLALASNTCSCGRHSSQTLHDEALVSDEQRLTRVVESAVVRAIFPNDQSRRAFLRKVGAATALAAISQFFPLRSATEVFAQTAAPREAGPQGRLHTDHLRHADHHGASDGVLCEA